MCGNKEYKREGYRYEIHRNAQALAKNEFSQYNNKSKTSHGCFLIRFFGRDEYDRDYFEMQY